MAFPIVPAFPVGISTPNVWVITIAAGATGVDMTTVTAVALGVVRLGDLSQATWHPAILGGATTSSLNVQLAFTGAEITTLGVYEISVTLTVPGGLVPCQALRLDAVDAHVLPQTGTAPTSTTTITPIAGIPGLSGLAAHAVLLGTATGSVSAVGPGGAGVPLLGSGSSADPVFGPLNLAGGPTVVTGQLPLQVVNVNTNGSVGRVASPYAAKAGDVIIVSLNVGAVVVNLPLLAVGQEVTVVIDDSTPPSAGSGLTINAAATTTLAQPSPNNGQASVTTLSFTNAAYAGGELTWSNCGSSDGRYLLV